MHNQNENVYSKSRIAQKYFHHLLTASNGHGHGIHSPFAFDFITKVLNDKQKYTSYEQVERIRKSLKKDDTLLTIKDGGAGSAFTRNAQRTVSSITRTAAKPRKYAQLLYRMVKYYQPSTILELGTSVGISTSYLALANPDAKTATVEGSGAIAAVARQNFRSLGLNNINVIEANFDKILPKVVEQLRPIDFAFIDGNHRETATIEYFRQLLDSISADAILVFDDIHWSEGMEKAWNYIRDYDTTAMTIDLFFIGIVFFRREFRNKQHFTIRF